MPCCSQKQLSTLRVELEFSMAEEHYNVCNPDWHSLAILGCGDAVSLAGVTERTEEGVEKVCHIYDMLCRQL